MAGLTAHFVPEAGHDGKAPMSVTLRWPPKAALEGRRPGPFILRGSLRSLLKDDGERLSRRALGGGLGGVASPLWEDNRNHRKPSGRYVRPRFRALACALELFAAGRRDSPCVARRAGKGRQ